MFLRDHKWLSGGLPPPKKKITITITRYFLVKTRRILFLCDHEWFCLEAFVLEHDGLGREDKGFLDHAHLLHQLLLDLR